MNTTPVPGSRGSRVVLYLRLSQSDDASTSIARQRKDLLELADREGWAVVAELVDDGISGRKTRANAEEALRMVRDGEADVLAVWKLDRWSRQGIAALGALVEALDSRPSALFVAHMDGLRSNQSAWRIIAAVLAEVARIEAENTSTRVKSSRAHLQATRRFTGFVPPFGYRSIANPDGEGRVLVPDVEEAALVRELAERLLSGASLTELTDDLRARRIPTTKSPARKARQAGKPTGDLDRGLWHLTVVRSLLRSETILGRTTHAVDGRRVPVTDSTGLPVTFWPPIIDAATMTLVRDRLPVARGKMSQRRRAARVLSGVAYCAVCDSKLYVVRGGKVTYYRCAAKRPDMVPPCPCPQLIAETLEEVIAERILAAHGDSPEVEEVRVVSNPEAEAALSDIEQALREATEALLGDDVDAPAIMERITALKARRAELQALPSAVHVTHVPTGRTLREAWDASDPATPEGVYSRRNVVLSVLDHVTLAPGGSRAQRPEDRVTFYWNDELEASVQVSPEFAARP